MTGNRTRIGRPRKAPEEARTERLSGIRLTSAERVRIEELAARAGLDVAEFCRRVILGQRLSERATTADEQALSELNRIGVNMNQIAHASHLGKVLGGMLESTLAELQAVMRRMGRDGS